MDDSFDDLTAPMGGDEESTGPAKPKVGLFVTAPCVSSIELEIFAMSIADPLLAFDGYVEFIEAEEEAAAPIEANSSPWNEPSLYSAMSALGREYGLHISLARSLGPAGYLNEYRAACRANGMKPII